MMLKNLQSTFRFSKEISKSDIKNVQYQGEMLNMIKQRRKVRNEALQSEFKNILIQEQAVSISQNILKISLFMKHDCWRSNYIYALLNYHKIGFRRVSDLEYLDRASYFNNLRGIKEEQRWPSIKIVIALQPKIVLTGVESIFEFFKENYYFLEDIQKEGPEIQAINNHINRQFVPYLQSLFWHPLLTFQYTFHTNLNSYTESSQNYNIVHILRRNGYQILKRTSKNLLEIAKDRERYVKSKNKVTQSLRELQNHYLKKNQYFGGSTPNHIDFYLFSLLKAKSGSHLFLKYLQHSVRGQTWRWFIKMSNVCQYDSERVTIL